MRLSLYVGEMREPTDAGADEVMLWPSATGDRPERSLIATLDAMQELAAQ